MTKRENFLSLIKRQGYQKVPVDFWLCPSLHDKFWDCMDKNQPDIDADLSYREVPDLAPAQIDSTLFHQFYDIPITDNIKIDAYGVGHIYEENCFHMSRMIHPMQSFDSLEQIKTYPYLDYSKSSNEQQKKEVEQAHNNGYAALGQMQMTIWEAAWYMRGMENLMMDMMSEDDMATVLLDKVTDNAIIRAQSFAKSGCDVIFLGDDIGMQYTIMLSEELYKTWLQPRLKRVIDSIKSVNPEAIIFYHSCGFITPLIPYLIEAGVEVLNPIQTECMDFKEIHDQFGQTISFNGTIGTQSTMPFGTPDEVRRAVFENMDIAGDKGGLLVAPTHMLEPEVPVENVIAYIKACNDYK